MDTTTDSATSTYPARPGNRQRGTKPPRACKAVLAALREDGGAMTLSEVAEDARCSARAAESALRYLLGVAEVAAVPGGWVLA